MGKNKLELSKLGHTWIFDLDGTVVKHNGYLIDGFDTLLPGVKDLFLKIPKNDYIIILTSRIREYESKTISFLKRKHIRFDAILFDIPFGERIIINDDKTSGLSGCYAIRKERDSKIDFDFMINEKL